MSALISLPHHVTELGRMAGVVQNILDGFSLSCTAKQDSAWDEHAGLAWT